MLGAYDFNIANSILELRIAESLREAEKRRLLRSLPRTQPTFYLRLKELIDLLGGRSLGKQAQAKPKCLVIYECACESAKYFVETDKPQDIGICQTARAC